MPTGIECRCCNETDFATLLHDTDPPVQCITQHPDFEAAYLNKTTLKIAYCAYRQQYREDIHDLQELVLIKFYKQTLSGRSNLVLYRLCSLYIYASFDSYCAQLQGA